MRERATSVMEAAGVVCIVTGVFLLAGVGWALIAGGTLALGISWMVTR